MVATSSNKTIAQNTVFLYFRMMVTMVITLYTSRMVLKILGVDDYGIYQAVGGIVGFLSFINNALSTGSSRFITFGLGEGDKDKLKRIFSTTLTAHIVLAVAIVVLAETLGLWFLHNKLVIADERLDAAEFVYHLSILTAFFSLTQVPYGACIIAHEKMAVYAYVSIVDAFLKLAIVYMLNVGDFDKLKLYALLLCIIQISIILFFVFYCVKQFEEARLEFFIDNKIFKEIAGFSGWSLFAGGSIALNNQGILLLLNMFFTPAVVTARSISLQVNMAANQFVTNFQTAANPQIVKRYAAKDYEGSKQLLLQTTKFSYYLMLLLNLPICLCAKPLLTIWLDDVPEYTVVFLQIIIIQSLFCVFDTSFYRALYAKGRLKENALLSPTLGFIQFPIVYFMFKMGCSPVALSWASLITYALLGLVVKPFLIIKIVDYTWKDIISVFVPCIKVTAVSVILPITVYLYLQSDNQLVSLLLISGISVMSVGLTVWFLGLNYETKAKVIDIVKKKIYKP
ncbi:MAG: MATE family efflux transporter [Bacteroidales bacterium]|nr:MATE family efflux transporter [Bacteroidales bacterium]MBR4326708.1 MATE family efflux transporter [Bacteroidales bacterium]